MGRAEPFLLTAIFCVFIFAYGSLPWLPGGLFLDAHEGDTYHLLDVLTRMVAGDVPHLDFVTPIGALAFWPVVLVLEAGFSAGAALVLAQLGVAVAMLPIVTYAAATRLRLGVAVFFGVTTLGLVLALSFGTPTSGVSISMHYNRWAWAVAFTMLLVALVPSKSRARPVLDGVLVGLLASALLLLKVTYFVALVPVAAIALWHMHRARGFVAALAAGSFVVIVVTLLQGFAFWLAYLSDLLLVARNEIRPFVGTSFDEIVVAPQYIAGTLIGVVAALVLRRRAPPMVGLAVLLMIPGFMYVTYQNFGNDPQWLLFLPVLLLARLPAPAEATLFGIDLRAVAITTVFAAGTAAFPSLFNVAMSPVEHLSFDKAEFLPMLPETAGHQDIFLRRGRAYNMTALVYDDQGPGPWAKYATEVDRTPIPEFGGVAFPYCLRMAGSRAMLETLGADLAAASLPAGSRLFTADLLAAYWFFAPVSPPPESAPWYYGELTGLENTDYVMVPKCAFAAAERNIILRELAASEAEFTLVRDNDLLSLFRVDR